MSISKNIFSSLGLVAVASLFFGCKREVASIPYIQTDAGSNATIQVINATLKAARNYVYVDGVPVSGTTFSYQGSFPATAYSFKVTPGSHNMVIRDTMPTSAQVPLTFTQVLDAGKYYTIFMYDTITSPKQVAVVNDISVPSDTTARLRFANFVYSPAGVPNVDVYSYKRIPGTPVFQTTAVLNNASIPAPVFTGSTPVFSNVASNSVSGFVPYASLQADTLYVFAAGTTTPLLAKGTITSLTPTRSYSATFNGSYRGNLAARVITNFATY